MGDRVRHGVAGRCRHCRRVRAWTRGSYFSVDNASFESTLVDSFAWDQSAVRGAGVSAEALTPVDKVLPH
ncbi:protein of unknown function [Burkholderia multivorans]